MTEEEQIEFAIHDYWECDECDALSSESEPGNEFDYFLQEYMARFSLHFHPGL